MFPRKIRRCQSKFCSCRSPSFPCRKTTNDLFAVPSIFLNCPKRILSLNKPGAVLRTLLNLVTQSTGSHHFPSERKPWYLSPPRFHMCVQRLECIALFVCCGSFPWSNLSKHMYYLAGYDVSKSDIIFVCCKNVLSDISRIASILHDTHRALTMRCCSKLFAYSSDFPNRAAHAENNASWVHCPHTYDS